MTDGSRYTISAITEKIKKELAIVKFNIEKYNKEIDKYRKNRSLTQRYYDYDLELDFSNNPKIPFDIDDRLYYYKAYHYQKIGLFNREDVPTFKVKLGHLSHDLIYELAQLNDQYRKFVLKQALSRIFEDINFDLYHDSISNRLEVELIK